MTMLRLSFPILLCATPALAQVAQAPLAVKKTDADLTKLPLAADVWGGAAETSVTLMGQPMVPPKPATTSTDAMTVQAVTDGKWIAFRLRWKDPEESAGGRLAQFSDAVAVEFPGKQADQPPPVFMGLQGMPVHILHWRAQFQKDKEVGVRDVATHYPNMAVNTYPFDYAGLKMGSLSPAMAKRLAVATPAEGHSDDAIAADGPAPAEFPREMREQYQTGRAAGNPASYAKERALDEIMAEGYGTSQVQAAGDALADGHWKDGAWEVVIARPLAIAERSTLAPDKPAFAGFAVWQGGKAEVGSRKSVTMEWTQLKFPQ